MKSTSIFRLATPESPHSLQGSAHLVTPWPILARNGPASCFALGLRIEWRCATEGQS